MPMTMIWMMINEDVAERNRVKRGTGIRNRKQHKAFVDRVYALLIDLDETWQFGSKHLFGYYLVTWLSYILLLLLPFVLLWSWLSGPTMIGVCVGLAIGGIVLNKFVLFPWSIEPMLHRYLHGEVRKSYDYHWRNRFIQFFDATGATMGELVPVMQGILEAEDRFNATTTWIPHFVGQDPGLTFYSLTTAYQR